MYCEFCDIHKENHEIMDILDHKIESLKFRQFYNYFGTKGCSSRKFREKDLLEAWGNDSKEEKLIKEVYMILKPGDRYPVKELKAIVSGIYEKLGISRTPKATDLRKYFKLTSTRITLPDKSLVNGFKLDNL